MPGSLVTIGSVDSGAYHQRGGLSRTSPLCRPHHLRRAAPSGTLACSAVLIFRLREPALRGRRDRGSLRGVNLEASGVANANTPSSARISRRSFWSSPSHVGRDRIAVTV